MIYALVPARGGSKRIPQKNIKEIAGKPLIWWVLNAAQDSMIDEIFVATDSLDIMRVVDGFGFDKVSVIGRSSGSATDDAQTEVLMKEFCEHYTFDGLMLLQATSPLITPNQINDILSMYNRGEFDSLTPLVAKKMFIWRCSRGKWSPVNYDPNNRPKSQDAKPVYVGCGAIYMMNRDNFLRYNCRFHGKIGHYIFPETMAIELDEQWQWPIVELLLKEGL